MASTYGSVIYNGITRFFVASTATIILIMPSWGMTSSFAARDEGTYIESAAYQALREPPSSLFFDLPPAAPVPVVHGVLRPLFKPLSAPTSMRTTARTAAKSGLPRRVAKV